MAAAPQFGARGGHPLLAYAGRAGDQAGVSGWLVVRACELRARRLRRAARPVGCEEFTLVLDSEWAEAAAAIDVLADVDERLAA